MSSRISRFSCYLDHGYEHSYLYHRLLHQHLRQKSRRAASLWGWQDLCAASTLCEWPPSSLRFPLVDDWAALWDNCSHNWRWTEDLPGRERNRLIESTQLKLSRANGWHGDSEILMLCNSRISVLIRIKEELHSTRLYYVQACRVLGSNLPILFGFQDHLRIEIKSNTACPTTNVFSCYSSRWLL